MRIPSFVVALTLAACNGGGLTGSGTKTGGATAAGGSGSGVGSAPAPIKVAVGADRAVASYGPPARDVTACASSDAKVATCDPATGTIHGVGPGTATITVSTKDGDKIYTVEVAPPPPGDGGSGVTPGSSSGTMSGPAAPTGVGKPGTSESDATTVASSLDAGDEATPPGVVAAGTDGARTATCSGGRLGSVAVYKQPGATEVIVPLPVGAGMVLLYARGANGGSAEANGGSSGTNEDLETIDAVVDLAGGTSTGIQTVVGGSGESMGVAASWNASPFGAVVAATGYHAADLPTFTADGNTLHVTGLRNDSGNGKDKKWPQMWLATFFSRGGPACQGALLGAKAVAGLQGAQATLPIVTGAARAIVSARGSLIDAPTDGEAEKFERLEASVDLKAQTSVGYGQVVLGSGPDLPILYTWRRTGFGVDCNLARGHRLGIVETPQVAASGDNLVFKLGRQNKWAMAWLAVYFADHDGARGQGGYAGATSLYKDEAANSVEVAVPLNASDVVLSLAGINLASAGSPAESARNEDSDALDAYFDLIGRKASGIYQAVGGSDALGIALAGWSASALGAGVSADVGFRSGVIQFTTSLDGDGLTFGGLPTSSMTTPAVWPQAGLVHFFK